VLPIGADGDYRWVENHADAFTFTDGTSASCVAGGKMVTEVDAEASQAGVDCTGKTVRIASGFVIIWNAGRPKALPPEVHDYLFFHECAHARVPTTDELKANCAGLQDMRAAARAGFAVESRLGVFYGPGGDYWARTLKGADVTASSKPPQRLPTTDEARQLADSARRPTPPPTALARGFRRLGLPASRCRDAPSVAAWYGPCVSWA
jgi:hypothetical protein